MNRIYYLFIGLFWMAALSSIAQPDRLWQEHHYRFDDESYNHSIWGTGGFELRSNLVTNALVNETIFEGTINTESSAFLVDADPAGRTRMNTGLSSSLWYKHKREKGPAWMIGIRTDERALGNLSNSLVQLYYRGNAPFEGTEMPLRSRINYWSGQGLGFGLEWSNPNITYGMTMSLMKIGRFQSLSIADDAQILTAPFGEFIDATLKMTLTTTANQQDRLAAWYGTGILSDMYLNFAPEEGKASFGIEVIGLGAAHFSGIQSLSVDRDTLFEGVRVDDILSFDNDLSNEADLDSLEALVGLVQDNDQGVRFLPGRVQLNYTRHLSEGISLALQLRQFFFSSPPQVRMGIALKVSRGLSFEPYVRAGGFTRFDYGVTGVINANNRFQLMVNYGLIERQIAVGSTTGQSLFLAGAFRF